MTISKHANYRTEGCCSHISFHSFAMQVQLTPGMHAREGISILQSDVKPKTPFLPFHSQL